MTDPDLLEKRIAFIETAVARLRGMARLEVAVNQSEGGARAAARV